MDEGGLEVRFTDAARADLFALADHIAADNPARALSFAAEIEEACLALAHHPLRYPIVPRYADMRVRRRVHGNYLIFYRVAGETVEILHILHGAMDIGDLL